MSDLKRIGIDVDVSGVIENGRRSFSESENDILRRLLLPRASPAVRSGAERPAPKAMAELPPDLPAPAPATRSTGNWAVDLSGRRIAAPNLKTAYRTLLVLLSEADPHFLEKFSKEQARSRRFVARSPGELYLASPRLAAKHAAPLGDGWYFDTNLSTDQVSRRARIAARLCGLRYGTDVYLLNNLQQI